jgi:hypothetical protein
VPRGYPRQEVPVGSGDVSGMCLTTAIRISSLPTQDRPVCSRMITFLVATGAGTQWVLAALPLSVQVTAHLH